MSHDISPVANERQHSAGERIPRRIKMGAIFSLHPKTSIVAIINDT